MSQLTFGDILFCDFSRSSPTYRDGFQIKNLYAGKHPALFVVSHKGALSDYFVLVCPMSDELKYSDLDTDLIRLSRAIDVENGQLEKDLHTVNCKMLLSVSSNQITCERKKGHVKNNKLIEIAKKITTHLDCVDKCAKQR